MHQKYHLLFGLGTKIHMGTFLTFLVFKIEDNNIEKNTGSYRLYSNSSDAGWNNKLPFMARLKDQLVEGFHRLLF